MAEENICVVARFRPLNERERAIEQREGTAALPRFSEDGRTVWVGPDEATGHYALDAVLPSESTQADVYAHASKLVEAVVQGYNATLLAYGQTGSGKTHSVMGDIGGDGSQAGLLPRAVRQVLSFVFADERLRRVADLDHNPCAARETWRATARLAIESSLVKSRVAKAS